MWLISVLFFLFERVGGQCHAINSFNLKCVFFIQNIQTYIQKNTYRRQSFKMRWKANLGGFRDLSKVLYSWAFHWAFSYVKLHVLSVLQKAYYRMYFLDMMLAISSSVGLMPQNKLQLIPAGVFLELLTSPPRSTPRANVFLLKQFTK